MDKKAIKEHIQQEIKSTEQLIVEYKELSQPIAPENSIGRVSRMDAINNKSINESALRKQEEKLKKLNYVLTKVDDKNFGRCAKCNSEIPLGRILIMPQSIYCVRCAR